MITNTTVDELEIAKFAQHASDWWNKDGPLKTLHDINPARIEFIQKFTGFAERHILDVGCGGGILSEGMALSGAIVTGLDVETHAIMAAQTHAAENQIQINYVCQPIEKYEHELFDVVTCMEML